jgi:hypothetical protein
MNAPALWHFPHRWVQETVPPEPKKGKKRMTKVDIIASEKATGAAVFEVKTPRR